MIPSRRLRLLADWLIPVLIIVGIVSLVGALAFAQELTVTVDPPAQEPGGQVTLSGSGWQPGESITVSFGGSTIATATADDFGNWQATGTIPEGMPAGEHPMDFIGSGGSQAETMYEVLEAAPGEEPGEEEPAGEEPAGEEPATPTEREDGEIPLAEEDGGLPVWAWILIGVLVGILVAAGGWLIVSRRGGPEVARTFTDNTGQAWEYCEGSACKLTQQPVTDTEGRRILVKCDKKANMCQGAGCDCVLFLDTTPPTYLQPGGQWHVKKPGERYSCRCVKKV